LDTRCGVLFVSVVLGGKATEMANALHSAKTAKNDEFYTQLADIENELKHYKDQLADKVVFCNCDDPFESNFFKYFAMNFEQLKLKKLIATCYDPSPIANTQLSLFGDDVPIKHKGMKKFANHAYKIELDHVLDIDKSGSIGIADIEKMLEAEKATLKNGGNSSILSYLDGDGDFRSDECVELLKQADVVITNPPFSLFRKYIAQLMAYSKQFLVIGHQNALTYRDIFKLIKENKVWQGFNNFDNSRFVMPDHYYNGSKYQEFKDGKLYGRVSGLRWYTNLDTTKRHELLTLYKKYTPEEYATYDNYDAINVDKVVEIPEDYDGKMGVPITFIDKYNPDQFGIIGLGISNSGLEIGVRGYRPEHKEYRKKVQGKGAVDGDLYMVDENDHPVVPYARIIIKRKDDR
jgi:hypothetical protein